MRRGAAFCVSLALALVLSTATNAAAAARDSWTTAEPLVYSLANTGSTTGFTIQNNEPGTAETGADVCGLRGRTAWWRVRGHGGTMVITTRGSDITGVIAVYAPSAANNPAALRGCTSGVLGATQLSFQADRGVNYFVQIGGAGATAGCPNTCADSGLVSVTAVPERPANDDRGAAQPIATGERLTVSNLGATQESAEPLSCGVGFAGTLWYRWNTSIPGTAVFTADATFGAAIAAYRAADPTPFACNAGGGGTVSVQAPVTAGSYLIQVGAVGADDVSLPQGPIAAQVAFAPKDDDRDGVPDPPDCDDTNPAIHQGAGDVPDDGVDQDCDGKDAVNLDRDGDGNARPADCDDNDPTRFRGAVDKPRNGKDENCDGKDADFPFMTATIQYAAAKLGRFTLLTQLAVARPPMGARVRVTCRGGGCKKRKVTVRVKRRTSRVKLARYFRNARLAPRTVVRVRVTKAGMYGKETRLTMRRGAAPKRRSRCVDPKSGKLLKC
jgi:hypothetical protein